MKYNGVIFDFNGTLFKDTEYHILAWGDLCKEICGKDLSREEMETEMCGVPNVEAVLRMDPSLSKEEAEAYSQKKEALYRDFVRNAPGGEHLTSGAEELFAWLNEKGIPFTIASASIIENIDFFVEYFHLDRWLDPAMIVYDDGTYSDKTAMFIEAKKRIGADRILVFEDSIAGITCAEQLGMNVIAMKTEVLKDVYRKHPCVIDTVDDFTGVIPYLENN